MARKKPHDLCEDTSVDAQKICSLKQEMLSERDLYGLAEIFSVLGDATRLKIIHALSHEELCVCDIAAILGSSISAVSHQLRILRTMRLVKFRKESKRVYYSLDDSHIKKLFDQGLEHVRE